MELITQPSLNIDGLRSEDVGEQSRTIIPERATAAIDMRLVKNISPEDAIRAAGGAYSQARILRHRRTNRAWKIVARTRKLRAWRCQMAAIRRALRRWICLFPEALVDVVNAAVGGGSDQNADERRQFADVHF